MKIRLGCELGYEITDQATIVLNVEVQRGPSQNIASERFVTPDNVNGEEHEFPGTRNRYRRMTLPRGTSIIRYEAEANSPVHSRPSAG
jgi:hypothetical protein